MDNILYIKILKYFLENPYQEVYLRELAKKLKISPFAVKKYLDIMLKDKLIAEERKANLRYIKANMHNLFFKYLKIAFSVKKLEESGLIYYIKENVENLSSIILFGSMAKGEDDRNSDIDILIIGNEKSLKMTEFEEKLGRTVNYHLYKWSSWNKQSEKNKAFYFDVISYGLQLYGELPIVK